MDNRKNRSLYLEYDDIGFIGLTEQGLELVKDFPTKPLDM
jgi:hypothetical protein